MELIKIENGEITLIDQALEQFKQLIIHNNEFKRMEQQVKEELLKAMGEHGIKSFDCPILKATYVAPTTRTRIDSKKLEAEYPLIAEEVKTTSPVKPSVRIQLK